MQKESDLKDMAQELKTFSKWMASGLIDSIFLAVWAGLQWLTNLSLSHFTLSGIDNYVLVIFQLLFAISTLAPIVIYIYTDIRVMLYRAQRRIRFESKQSKKDLVVNK